MYIINDLPLHITSNRVNCDMVCGWYYSLSTSDKGYTVRKELQRSINETSDCCDNNTMILHPAKTKGMLLAARQKRQLRQLHLNLKDSHMSTGTLALLLMLNLAGDHTLLAFVKQCQKIFICCHSSDTLWTLLGASCLTMPSTMHLLSGTAVVISYLTNLIFSSQKSCNTDDI